MMKCISAFDLIYMPNYSVHFNMDIIIAFFTELELFSWPNLWCIICYTNTCFYFSWLGAFFLIYNMILSSVRLIHHFYKGSINYGT